MNNYFESGAIESAPSLDTLTSQGYPTEGNANLGIPPTKPGAAWFYSVNEEIRNTLIKLGVTPDPLKVNQMAEAIYAQLATKSDLDSPTFTGSVKVPTAVESQNPINKEQLESIVSTLVTTNTSQTVTGNKDFSGDLTVNSKRVVTSVNSFEADETGNVSVNLNGTKVGQIGTPGTQGFGVGIYPGTDSELTAIGLSPMSGYSDIYSDNYGNYMHYKGGQMIFVPAFYIRYGSEDAAQYATYGSNSLEVKNYDEFESQTEANAQGFYLHRAFIDGGEVKKGFFISKYHMTVTTVGTQSVPISGMTTPTTSITPVQMMDYARGLGYGWNCPSAYMMSAIDILAMCHGQFATWTNACKWYDPSEVTTYPAQGRGTTNMGLYSHNGQTSGLMGFEYYWEFCCGFTTAGTSATQGQTAMSTNDVYILKSDKKLADLTSGWGGTTDAWGTTSTLANMHDVVTVDYPIKTNQIRYWGNTTYPVFTDPSTDNGLSLFGILPCNSNAVGNGVNFIAKSVVYTNSATQNLAFYVHGQSVTSRNYDENAFARHFSHWRVYSGTVAGFLVGGYAA